MIICMGRNSETIKYHQMIDAGMAPTEKWCSACKRWFPLENFGADRSRKDGLANQCRPCARARYSAWVAANSDRHKEKARERAARVPLAKRQDHHRKHRYGMEPGEYDRMLAAQGGRCGVCGMVPKKALVVDHNHATDKVRGLLCYTCNRGLHMLDAPGLLEAALRYLGESDDALDLRAPQRMGPSV